MRSCKYEAGVKCTIIHERWKFKLHLLHQNIIGFCYKLHYKWIGTFETAKKWNHFMFCKNIETILFQLTLPGIDEEIAYRGIMLGLLVSVLKPFRETIFHPAILVTAILFGLGHGLFITKSFELSFDIFSFLSSCILGIIWGWLTIKSGSIFLSLTSHNLGNFPIKFFSLTWETRYL